jgi:Carboxypeptidase regulatory-like domain
MMLSLKPRHKVEKKLSDKELVHRLDTDTAILIVLTSCIGVATTIIVSLMPGFTLPLSSTVTSSLATDLGSIMGFVRTSDGLPTEGASVVIYKHMGLIYSADKNAGYIEYVITESDGSYSFDGLPSGVYRITVTYPDRVVQIVDNYAVWPSSGSSYVFAAE